MVLLLITTLWLVKKIAPLSKPNWHAKLKPMWLGHLCVPGYINCFEFWLAPCFVFLCCELAKVIMVLVLLHYELKTVLSTANNFWITFMYWTAKRFCIHFADLVFDIMQGTTMELGHHMHNTTFQGNFYNNNIKTRAGFDSRLFYVHHYLDLLN